MKIAIEQGVAGGTAAFLILLGIALALFVLLVLYRILEWAWEAIVYRKSNCRLCGHKQWRP